MKTRRRIVMIILVIAGIWVAAIATHYVSVAWHTWSHPRGRCPWAVA